MSEITSKYPPITSVAIAICTWNRASLLSQTLERLSSLLSLKKPQGVNITVVIIDNNSTDETQSVIEKFANSELCTDRNLTQLKEEQQGHAFARNRAIQSCDSDLIIWTDDDVLVPADWVSKYVDAANEQSDMAFWGAAIEPFFSAGKPKWIQKNWSKLAGCFAGRDLGDRRVELTSNKLPYGANFAIRGEVLRQYSFATDLGRRENEILGEDELDLMRRLLADGHRGSWVPHNTVQHVIPTNRANAAYVFDYFVGQGRALVVNGEVWHENSAKLLRESKSEYRKYWIKRLFASSDAWSSHLIRSALAKGQAVELMLSNKNAEAPS
jgi:glycosyltransferase involved in cell wall biosynthesis